MFGWDASYGSTFSCWQVKLCTQVTSSESRLGSGAGASFCSVKLCSNPGQTICSNCWLNRIVGYNVWWNQTSPNTQLSKKILKKRCPTRNDRIDEHRIKQHSLYLSNHVQHTLAKSVSKISCQRRNHVTNKRPVLIVWQPMRKAKSLISHMILLNTLLKSQPNHTWLNRTVGYDAWQKLNFIQYLTEQKTLDKRHLGRHDKQLNNAGSNNVRQFARS